MYPCTYKWNSAPVASRVMRDMVQRLQGEVSKLPQYEPTTKHYIHGGLYVREVWRDAGVLIIGKVHKRAHLYVVVSGTIRVTTDEGVTEVTGPHVIKCQPGTKRAVLAITDAVCLTVHATEALTPEDAEAEIVEDDPDALFDAQNRVKPGVLKYDATEVLQ